MTYHTKQGNAAVANAAANTWRALGKDMLLQHGPTAGIFLGIPAIGSWLASRRQNRAENSAHQLMMHAMQGNDTGFQNWVGKQKFTPAQQQALTGIWQDPMLRSQLGNQHYAVQALGHLQQFGRQPGMTPELLQRAVSQQMKTGAAQATFHPEVSVANFNSMAVMQLCLQRPISPAGWLLKAAADHEVREIRLRDALQGRRHFTEEEQADIDKQKKRWLPEILQAEDTRLPDMLASPERQGILGAAGGGLGGATLGAILGNNMTGSAGGAGLGALLGGGLGAATGGIGLLLHRYLKNRDVVERMRRLPPGATLYDKGRTDDVDPGSAALAQALGSGSKFASQQAAQPPWASESSEIGPTQSMASQTEPSAIPGLIDLAASHPKPPQAEEGPGAEEGGTNLLPYLAGGGGLAALAAAALIAHRTRRKAKQTKAALAKEALILAEGDGMPLGTGLLGAPQRPPLPNREGRGTAGKPRLDIDPGEDVVGSKPSSPLNDLAIPQISLKPHAGSEDSPAEEGGSDMTPWLAGGGVGLAALAAAALLAHRNRRKKQQAPLPEA